MNRQNISSGYRELRSSRKRSRSGSADDDCTKGVVVFLGEPLSERRDDGRHGDWDNPLLKFNNFQSSDSRKIAAERRCDLPKYYHTFPQINDNRIWAYF